RHTRFSRDWSSDVCSSDLKIHGEKYRRDVLSAVSVAWERQPYIEGAWVRWPSRGAAFSLLQRPAGRVYFAGDWLSHLIAWKAGEIGRASGRDSGAAGGGRG